MATGDRMRVNMYLPRGLTSWVDDEAKKIGCSRTEMVIHILLNYFEQNKVMKLADMVHDNEKGN